MRAYRATCVGRDDLLGRGPTLTAAAQRPLLNLKRHLSPGICPPKRLRGCRELQPAQYLLEDDVPISGNLVVPLRHCVVADSTVSNALNTVI